MDIYTRLAERFDLPPIGAPKSQTFIEILRILFEPEEAELALHMGFGFETAEKIAGKSGHAIEDAENLLKSMADKVIIFTKEKDGILGYALLPTFPGLYEFPFFKGATTPELKKLGALWEKYYYEGMGAELTESKTSIARVIPVEREVKELAEIVTHERVSHLIEKARIISVSKCVCRVSVTHSCGKMEDTCLLFDTTSTFLADRGYARIISKEEAYEILRQAEEEGLVHCVNNSRTDGVFICNCCPCCCSILKGLTKLKNPNAIARSGYRAVVNQDLCSGCSLCMEERCPVDAVDMGDDLAGVAEDRCIGCGLCASTCPSEAIQLISREDHALPPATWKEVMGRIAVEKGKR